MVSKRNEIELKKIGLDNKFFQRERPYALPLYLNDKSKQRLRANITSVQIILNASLNSI